MWNKVALITGAAAGIGRAIAERYAARGASVVLSYAAGEQQAQDVVSLIAGGGGKALAVRADVTRVDDLDRLFAAATVTFGRLDIVVANAGVDIADQAVLDVSEDDFDRAFRINARGTFLTLQRAARAVADNGRIICVGTGDTRFPLPGRGLHGGSKIAAQFLVEVLAKEIGHRGVTVNSILAPAFRGADDGVARDVGPSREVVMSFRPMRRMADIDDVADAAEYLASPLASFVSGQHLLVSGGGPA